MEPRRQTNAKHLSQISHAAAPTGFPCRLQFSCKVGVATTLGEGFVVCMRSFPCNPYDGHTLRPALEQVEILTDQRPDLAVVDRGHGADRNPVLISAQGAACHQS